MNWNGLGAESTSDPDDGRVSVDLTDVTFVGEEGKKLLEAMYGEGAKLKASGCATRRLVEEIESSFTRPRKTCTFPIDALVPARTIWQSIDLLSLRRATPPRVREHRRDVGICGLSTMLFMPS